MYRWGLLCSAMMTMSLAAGTAAAQGLHGGGMPSQEIEVLSRDGNPTIPFELVNNHVIIPISVSGSKFQVILDTGMPMSGLMLYGTEVVENLQLEYGSMKARIGGAGGDGKFIEASVAQGVTVDVENVRMKNSTVIVAPPISHFTFYHDGVIGASLFNNFVVEIKYDEQRITLHDPDTYTPPDSATALPLTFKHNIPFAEVTVTMEDGHKVPLTVAVDLGASHAISLNVDSTDAIAVPENTIHAVIGRGVGGVVRGEVGRIRRLDLGDIALTDVVATFPVADHQHPGGMDSRNGNLGDGVLKRFNVTFSYALERMFLTPNREFEAPFEWDMSGMRLEPLDDTALRIDSILGGSPAEKAGLAEDDVVTHVNGRAVSVQNMIEIRKLMKRDGAVLEIRATRAGKPIEVKLELRRLI
ncbi:MAG: aspartyl protease family protein [Acidobacteria bacterium]|nr:aspartyl protease family protein [Acidobacteriota bacterium]